MIECKGGEIRFFYLNRSGAAHIELVKQCRLQPNDLPNKSQSVCFMQCINYIGMKDKARGTLCSLAYEKEDKIFINIGCICI